MLDVWLRSVPQSWCQYLTSICSLKFSLDIWWQTFPTVRILIMKPSKLSNQFHAVDIQKRLRYNKILCLSRLFLDITRRSLPHVMGVIQNKVDSSSPCCSDCKTVHLLSWGIRKLGCCQQWSCVCECMCLCLFRCFSSDFFYYKFSPQHSGGMLYFIGWCNILILFIDVIT